MGRFACTARNPTLAALFSLTALCGGCGNKNMGASDGGGGDMVFITAPHREPPEVAWQGDAGEEDAAGPKVIRSMRLVSIVAGNDELATQLLDFGDSVGKSTWYTALATEYGLGTAGPSVRITGPAINAERMDENGMLQYIDAALASTDPPTIADGRTMIVLYLPARTQFRYKGSLNECNQISMEDKTFGAYHGNYGTLGDAWAPVMRCMPPKGQTALEQLTLFATQQIADALTNPGNKGYSAILKPGEPPWMSSAFIENTGQDYVEVGELCSVDTRLVEEKSTYQRFLSNKAVRKGGDPCAPPLSVPYYNVTTELDWYGGNPGDTLMIELTGWSTASVGDWPFRAIIGASGDLLHFATARVESTTNATFAGITYQTINNGRTATLKVTIPPNAKSGWWNLVHVRSFRLDDSGVALVGEDYAHRWTIGTYVP